MRSFWAKARAMALIAIGALILSNVAPNIAMAADPIRIGMTMALTGGVAPIGKQVLAALQIWRDDVNAKGGLLGRPVELVFYDDQSNPANVPQLYTKLIEVDKVDLLIGPYATNMVAPAIPVLMQIKKTTIGILANAANSQFHYDQYFSMLPTGPEPQKAFSRGFFELAAGGDPAAEDGRDRRRRRRIRAERRRRRARDHQGDGRLRDRRRQEISADHDRLHADHARGAGAQSRHRLRRGLSAGFRRHRARRQRNRADAENVRRHLHRSPRDADQDAARAADERHRQQRSVPAGAEPSRSPARYELLAKYQAVAKNREIGSDRLGVPAARLRGRTGAGAGGRRHQEPRSRGKLADYMRSHTFKTVVGDIAFGKDGEWAKSRVVFTQFQHVTGNTLDQFKDTTHEVIVWPKEYKTGDMIYPYAEAKKP